MNVEESRTMDANLAAEFWTAVADCLVRFHHFEVSAARERSHGLWERLRHMPQPAAFQDLIYHEEPWYIACDLAGRQNATLTPEDSSQYKAILQRHGLFPAERNHSMKAGT